MNRKRRLLHPTNLVAHYLKPIPADHQIVGTVNGIEIARSTTTGSYYVRNLFVFGNGPTNNALALNANIREKENSYLSLPRNFRTMPTTFILSITDDDLIAIREFCSEHLTNNPHTP